MGDAKKKTKIIVGCTFAVLTGASLYGDEVGFFETNVGIATNVFSYSIFYAGLLMGFLSFVTTLITNTENSFKKNISGKILYFLDLDKMTKKRKIAVFMICFILTSGYLTMKQYWGSDTIGSFFAKNDFTTTYYVNAFEERNNAKNYRLKAEIEVENGMPYPYRVYFPNGGYLYFEIDKGWDEPLVVGEQMSYSDQNDKRWYLELTGEKAD